MAIFDEKLSKLFKALADTTRRHIIEELLLRDNQSLFELHARLISKHQISHTRQAFSRHLSTLEGAGIIKVEWQGNTKLHSLDTSELRELPATWLSKLVEEE
jgi:DNA-binding transcriptional ArsR family regulator